MGKRERREKIAHLRKRLKKRRQEVLDLKERVATLEEANQRLRTCARCGDHVDADDAWCGCGPVEPGKVIESKITLTADSDMRLVEPAELAEALGGEITPGTLLEGHQQAPGDCDALLENLDDE